MFRVILTQRAIRDLKNIDKESGHRIAQKLKEYAGDPFKYARKLTSSQMAHTDSE